jgi:radical SAM superfamily enzyme YgiQ (UPF0313 family)
LADVVVTHSYHLAYDPKQLRKMQPYMPLATLYAATALRDAGVSVAVFDAMLEKPSPGFAELIAAERPKVVVIYEDDFNFLSKMCLTRMRGVAWMMAGMARAAGAITVAHGSDSTDNPLLFLQNGFDYVCCGEAEEALVRLCGAVLSAGQIPEIDGLARLDGQGNLTRGPQRLAKNPAWAELSFPARDLIDLEPYRQAWVEAHGYFSVNMVSSRGCPYHCNWCAKPISGNEFQLRPPAAVAEEMKLLRDAAGAQHIWFGDDIFALSHDWVLQFAEEVTKKDAALPFKIQSRANLMTRETVRHLKTAGCVEVWMGVESGSQKVLNAMDKGLSLPSVVAARKHLREAEIRACYFLQLGYPGETWKELEKTIGFVRQTRPDDIGVSFSYPLPGTVFYERVRSELGRKRNWIDSDDLCIMFKGAYTTDFYRAVRDALHAEVDSRSRPDSGDAKAELDKLWRKVDAMEPISRNPDASCSLEVTAPRSAAAFVPVDELASLRSA